jgi:hypothetical protein
MIGEGDGVRALPREESRPSQKYAGQTGVVTKISATAVCDETGPYRT